MGNHDNVTVGGQNEGVIETNVEERGRSCMPGDGVEVCIGKGDGSLMDAGQDLSKPLWTFSMGCTSSTKSHKVKKVRRVSRKVEEVLHVEQIGPRREKRKDCAGNELVKADEAGGMGKRVCRDPVLEEYVDMDESYGSLTVAEVGQIQPREEQ